MCYYQLPLNKRRHCLRDVNIMPISMFFNLYRCTYIWIYCKKYEQFPEEMWQRYPVLGFCYVKKEGFIHETHINCDLNAQMCCDALLPNQSKPVLKCETFTSKPENPFWFVVNCPQLEIPSINGLIFLSLPPSIPNLCYIWRHVFGGMSIWYK